MPPAYPEITFYAYISGSWVLLDDMGGAVPTKGRWGIVGNKVLDRVADPGDLTLTLNNSTGQYTPGGPYALTGFQKGIPVKMVQEYDGESHVWNYYISRIEPRLSVKDQKCTITCVTWLDYGQRHNISNPGFQTNKRGDQVLQTAVDLSLVSPQGVDFDEGVETFPTAFDTTTSHTTIYSEMGKVAFSELGYCYERKDGTLVFESADARPGTRTVDALPLLGSDSGFALNEDDGFELNEDGGQVILNQVGVVAIDAITDFDAPYGDNQINRMTVWSYPRRLDASAVVLFQLDNEIIIGSGQTYILKGTWADPNGGLPINAQDVITPVVTTDYTMFTATGGGGSNISTSVSVTYWSAGTEGFTAHIKNTNASTGYLNKWSPRGTGIYQYNPISHEANNWTSIRANGVESETLHQKYKNDLYAGRVFADSQVAQNKDARTVLRSVTFIANKSPDCMRAWLWGEVGQLHYIEITELGITGNYYIQGIEFEMRGKIVYVTWIVSVALSILTGCGLTPVAVEFNGTASGDAVDYGYLPSVYSDSVSPVYSISVWLKSDIQTGEILAFWNSNFFGGLYTGAATVGGEFKLSMTGILFDAAAGVWITDDLTADLSENDWYHVVYTYDGTSINNNPLIYLDGVSKTVNETNAPSGSAASRNSAHVTIGNYSSSLSDFANAIDGQIFDPRVYNRILTADEVTTLFNSGTPSASVGPTNGLVFQPFAVRSDEAAAFAGKTLTADDMIFDSQFKAVGKVHGAPIGRAAP